MVTRIDNKVGTPRRGVRQKVGRRCVAATLLFCLLYSVQASTVNFNFQDLSGAPLNNVKVIVSPVAPPYVNGPEITAANTYPFYTSPSGTAQIPNMQQGIYSVRLYNQPATIFKILVPNDSNTYNAAQLITALSWSVSSIVGIGAQTIDTTNSTSTLTITTNGQGALTWTLFSATNSPFGATVTNLTVINQTVTNLTVNSNAYITTLTVVSNAYITNIFVTNVFIGSAGTNGGNILWTNIGNVLGEIGMNPDADGNIAFYSLGSGFDFGAAGFGGTDGQINAGVGNFEAVDLGNIALVAHSTPGYLSAYDANGDLNPTNAKIVLAGPAIYVSNWFIPYTGNSIAAPSLAPAWSTNSINADATFGDPVNINLTNANIANILVSNRDSSAHTVSWPSYWSNNIITNGLTCSIPPHSLQLFAITAIYGDITNIDFRSPPGGGGGGGSVALNPSQCDTNVLGQSEIKTSASVTNLHNIQTLYIEPAPSFINGGRLYYDVTGESLQDYAGIEFDIISPEGPVFIDSTAAQAGDGTLIAGTFQANNGFSGTSLLSSSAGVTLSGKYAEVGNGTLGNVKGALKVTTINDVNQPYYISSSFGSDSNDGLTTNTPFQTILYADANTPPNSTRLLIGGAGWFTNIANNNVMNLTNSGTWGSYGPSQAVIYSTNTNALAIVRLSSNNITLSNVFLLYSIGARTNKWQPNILAAGVCIETGGGIGATNDTIINCTVSNASIGILTIASNNTGGTTNIQLIGNHLVDCGSFGIYGNCTTQPPATYLNTNWVVANNIAEYTHGTPVSVFGADGEGICLIAMTGLKCTNNLAQYNGFAFPTPGGGPGGLCFVYCTNSLISNNVSRFNVAAPGGNDGFGLDMDKGCGSNTIVGNLCYANGGPGLECYSTGPGNTWLRNICFGDATAYIFGTSQNSFGAEMDLDPGAYATAITNEVIVSNIFDATVEQVTGIYYNGLLTYGTNKIETNFFSTALTNGQASRNIIVWDDSANKTGFTGNNYYCHGEAISWYWNFASYLTLSSWGVDPLGNTQNPNYPSQWVYWPNQSQWQFFINQTMNGWLPSAALQTLPLRNTLIGGAGSNNMGGQDNYLGGFGTAPNALHPTNNTIIGNFSAIGLTNGVGNQVIGLSSGGSNDISGDSLFGEAILTYNQQGVDNTMDGEFAGLYNKSASNMTVMGFFGFSGQSGVFATNTEGGGVSDLLFQNIQWSSNAWGFGSHAGINVHFATNVMYFASQGQDHDAGLMRFGDSGGPITNFLFAGTITANGNSSAGNAITWLAAQNSDANEYALLAQPGTTWAAGTSFRAHTAQLQIGSDDVNGLDLVNAGGGHWNFYPTGTTVGATPVLSVQSSGVAVNTGLILSPAMSTTGTLMVSNNFGNQSNYFNGLIASTNSFATTTPSLIWTNWNNSAFNFGAGTNGHHAFWYMVSGQSLDGSISYESQSPGFCLVTNNGTTWGIATNVQPAFQGAGPATGVAIYVSQTGIAGYVTNSASTSERVVAMVSDKAMTR